MVGLGGGARGTVTANRRRRRFDADEAEIHVVGRDDRHRVSIAGGVTAQRPSRVWAGRVACAWAAIFALMSLYWAAGGTLGGKTVGAEIYRLGRERDPSFVAQLWAAFALKALIAMLALALVQAWGRRLPRRLLLVLAGATGAGITLYAVGGLIQHALMATGTISTSEALGTYALPWHLALWDPFWLVGGLLFLAATRAFQKSP
jgi:hypothetical protein